MNKKEKEAIETLKLLEGWLSDCEVCEESHCNCAVIKDRNTVLNLLEKQDLKIDQQKRLLDIQEREISKQLGTIEKQNKMIDEMLYHLAGIYKNKFGWNKKEVKEYFEKKVSE